MKNIAEWIFINTLFRFSSVLSGSVLALFFLDCFLPYNRRPPVNLPFAEGF